MKWFDFINTEIRGRLAKRFFLSDNPEVTDPFTLLSSVQPVTQFDDLLAEAKNATNDTMNLDIAAGTFVLGFAVPKGKRWKLLHIYRQNTTAASAIWLKDADGLVVILSPSSTESQIPNLNPLIMEETWEIGLKSTDDVGDANRDMHIHYLESDSFNPAS